MGGIKFTPASADNTSDRRRQRPPEPRHTLNEPSNDISVSPTEGGVEHHLDHLERHLALLQRQVEQLQRLASLGTVCTMVAHEFNNTLTPIISYCQYAQQRGEDDLMRTAVDKTLKNARRLSVLCHRVLGMAVDDRMGPTDTAILPLVKDAVDCLGRDLEKDDIRLTIDVAEDLKARTAAGSLQQVLFNLVINARQAMLDKGGRLDVSARPTADGTVTIQVADTGHGMKPEHKEMIFEPFFTTKQHEGRPDRRGIGLGLHICKQLMEEQDGTISVDSTAGRGTTFTLTLPAAG